MGWADRPPIIFFEFLKGVNESMDPERVAQERSRKFRELDPAEQEILNEEAAGYRSLSKRFRRLEDGVLVNQQEEVSA